MQISTRFNVGDKVYVIYTPHEMEKCPTCELFHPKKAKYASRVLEVVVRGFNARYMPNIFEEVDIDYDFAENPEDVNFVHEPNIFATREEAEEAIKHLED